MKNVIIMLFLRLCSLFPIKNKIIFISSNGKYYNDNPKMLFEHIKLLRSDLKCIWLMNDTAQKIDGAIVVKKRSLKALYHIATAKIWINDSRMGPWTVKRKGQYYVQTWHGDIALKKIEKDAQDKLPAKWVAHGKRDSKMIDLFITGSKHMADMVNETFWYDGEVLNIGMPRSDIFFYSEDKLKKIKKRVMEYYKLDENRKICLYAPTFRQNKGEETDFHKSLDVYLTKEDCSNIISVLRKRFGGEWSMIVRLHPSISDKISYILSGANLINGNEYDDINELIIACDVMISDYSSCMFDAMINCKPVFLYTADVNDYLNDRGCYFKLEELPFPYFTNVNDMKKAITEYDENTYLKKIETFESRIGMIHNPFASEEAALYILKKALNET